MSTALRPRHLHMVAVVGIGMAVWGLWIGLQPMYDNSLFTHLAAGRLIADGDFPRHDLFTFTAAGEPWVVQSWLVAGAYGLLEELWGGHGVLFFHGAVTTLLALVVFKLTAPATSLTARLGVAAVAVTVGAGAWSERPLLVGLLLFGTTLLVAEGKLPAPVLLPGMWIWVNSHGSFPLGIVLLVALALGHRLDGQMPHRELRALAWAAVGAVVAVANPLGPTILRFPLELLSRQDVLRGIVEWQAPNFTVTVERVFLLQILITFVALARRPSYRDVVPTAVFVAAALLAARNIAPASIVMVPVMARGLTGLGTIAGDRRTPAFSIAGIVLGMLGLLISATALSEPAFDKEPYPTEALAWLGGVSALQRTPTATPDLVGNFLEGVAGPRRLVFMDDRYDMFPDEIVDDYATLLKAGRTWEEVLERHDIGAIVWQSDEPLASLLRASASWRIAYHDERWLVALPRQSGR